MKTPALISALALIFTGFAFAAEPPPKDVVLLDHAKMAEAFAKGSGLLANSAYKIMAGRRVQPGIVEIHDHDTDILYIVEGSATFVTGGTAVDPKTTGAGEVRAPKTTGGTPHHLTKGDVIVIPKTIPHWFTEVSGTFLYFVVKVTE
jgi:quercetin dioxygenase-like cupin family protein